MIVLVTSNNRFMTATFEVYFVSKHFNRCVNHALSGERTSVPLPDLPPGEAPEPILTFMERTYAAGRGRTTFDAGSPLLLTPYIEENKLKEAREAAYVDPAYLLPGMDSYAGYLTVSDNQLILRVRR